MGHIHENDVTDLQEWGGLNIDGRLDENLGMLHTRDRGNRSAARSQEGFYELLI